MRPLLANTEKCCFLKVGEDTGGIAYVPSGLKTLGWGRRSGRAAAFGRSAHLEPGVCFINSLANRCKLSSSLLSLNWWLCDQAGDLGSLRETRCSADGAACPRACQWLSSNQVGRRNSALFVKQHTAPS